MGRKRKKKKKRKPTSDVERDYQLRNAQRGQRIGKFVRAKAEGRATKISIPYGGLYDDDPEAMNWLSNAMRSLAGDFKDKKIQVSSRKGPDGQLILDLEAEKEIIEKLELVAKARNETVSDYINTAIRHQMAKEQSKSARLRLPGPVIDTAKLTKRQMVVELYQRTLTGLRNPLRTTNDSGRVDLPELWAYVNEASIFEVPLSLYLELYHQADVEVTNHVGEEWAPYDPKQEPDLESGMRHAEATIELGQAKPYPEFMPFEHCFFVFDTPWMLNPFQTKYFVVGDHTNETVFMYAILAARGEVFSFYIIDDPDWTDDPDTIGVGIGVRGERIDNKWLRPVTLMPWVFNWIVDWINSHRLTVEETTTSFSYRHHYKRVAKRNKNKPIPPPYYTVLIKDVVRQERPRTADTGLKMRRAQRHRSKVRGHESMRVRRGKLPLDPKLEARLRKNPRRKIFKEQPLDDETYADLAKRGIRPKAYDEWLAVLKYWRKEFMRGPQDGPFIPAVRKSGRKRKRRRKKAAR